MSCTDLTDDLEDDMLGIEPLELHFTLGHNKQLSQSIQLSNDTDHYIAFHFGTRNWLLPLKTVPYKDVVPPRSKCTVTVTLVPLPNKTLNHAHYVDDFCVWSTRVKEGVTANDIFGDVFDEGRIGEMTQFVEGNEKVVDTVNLNVILDIPLLNR
ncbi:hypothetical protein QOZ80_5BG0443890 [Eleusine coracana subsp. coracana]|nr:hypothetical protein QOZ80_5BG0443890 [Eleusine coracana subsp. coracana]